MEHSLFKRYSLIIDLKNHAGPPELGAHHLSLEILIFLLFLSSHTSIKFNATEVSNNLDELSLGQVGEHSEKLEFGNAAGILGVFGRGRFAFEFVASLEKMLNAVLKLLVILLELFDFIR